ncbi:hypothetical protein K503DRAFT_863475 [Rhizopogon vinicolor AM-OR11-026]|uniref:Extracellular mutant protein 11 C-terminal domain-containing protein n=1 Tax=Rhizopogon vinicolor AM-OR11-026 TaxID=1314800 RepID=A0A1B7NAP3_9AGAM|nr:hypothetical protein K503DRAFT_863475 [Rhizopogon vinicolor AM-OR11-026]
MSARQTFIPRSASRASNHADTEHPFDMPPRSQSSIGQPQHNRSIQHDPDPTLSASHKNDSEKRPRFAAMLGKNKHAGTGNHQPATDTSFSSASGRFSGVRRPDIQSLAPPPRSSSPFCGIGSPFVAPPIPGPKFAQPTSPMPSTVPQRADLTISGLKDAHISTGGVVSGLISASRVIAVPVPSYEPIHRDLDGKHTFSSNKSSAPKSQHAQLERIHEDLEPEIANEDEALLGAHRTGVTAPVLRRMKRTIQGVQEDEANFSLPDEIEYGRRVKRVRIDEFTRELPSVRPDDSNHSGVDHDHHRLQPDLDTDAARQSSPPICQPGSGAADDLSLEGMFAGMETFLSAETFAGLVRKWSTCSREEWLQGSEELVNQFKDIIDWVKDNLTANITLYSRLDDQVRDRREEQAQLTEHLRRGLGTARTDLIAICRGK